MAATNWSIDPTHSEIGFKVKHLMFTNVTGKFGTFEGGASFDENDLSNAKFEFSAEANSISTGNTDRDNHLKSADFFDAESFPKLTFQSTGVTKTGENEYEVSGDFSMHGVTKNIALAVEFAGIAKDPWGNTKAGFSINGVINRKDFGLNWNATLEAGGVLVSEDVKLQIDVQLAKN